MSAWRESSTRARNKWREILMRLICVVLMAWDLDALGTRWLEDCRALTRNDLMYVWEERGLSNRIKKTRDQCTGQEVGILWRGRKALHSRGGRTPFILIQTVIITGQRTYSCAARPKLLGKVHKNRKRRVRVLYRRAKEDIKIKTSLTRSLCKIFGLGMTRGTYNAGRGLFARATATLSADIPCVDARPYRLVVWKSSGFGKLSYK